jgi:hypothetical protein
MVYPYGSMVLPFDTKARGGHLYSQQKYKFIATVESHYMGVVFNMPEQAGSRSPWCCPIRPVVQQNCYTLSQLVGASRVALVMGRL